MSDVNTSTGVILEELNDKVDRDCNNLAVEGRSLISGLGMPSGRVISLTLAASGSTYTVPANGWVSFRGNNVNNGYIEITVLNSVNVRTPGSSSGDMCVYVPVKKGQQFKLYYGNLGSGSGVAFIYAEGEENV